MSSPIVHIELPANDTKAASEFYSNLFGWKIDHDPNFDYYQFRPESGPGGGFVNPSPATEMNIAYEPGKVLVYVASDDIEASLAKAESLGAKTVLPKTEIPGVGWFAVFSDPTGNNIGLYTSKAQVE
jgi:predicted enzyme related to lactoylglutathione lyase